MGRDSADEMDHCRTMRAGVEFIGVLARGGSDSCRDADRIGTGAEHPLCHKRFDVIGRKSPNCVVRDGGRRWRLRTSVSLL